jgi:MoaA/NifB/PqqE/SkfB family radical SAM enzyme
MCGQWSEEGYMHADDDALKPHMKLADWKRVVDELAEHQIGSLLLRGGEPFLFPDIIELLEYIHNKSMFISIDTNGTMLKKYAADIARIGQIHLTISVDGPEEIHDQVRGVPGCFQKIREGVAHLHEAEKMQGNQISQSINFTISPYSYKGLGVMPDVARSLGIGTMCIVPYYYVPDKVGQQYAQELTQHLNCAAFSWSGFHREDSGVDIDEFLAQYRTYLDKLDGVYNFPYMALSEAEYADWFSNPLTPVGSTKCSNVEKLIDIQPTGEANFCIDFPDYNIGNVREASIRELWNGERARRFREYRRKQPLSVCYRCGAKYMAEIEA